MPAKRKNYDLAVELYNSGLSLQDIATFYPVSRQTLYPVLKRRGVKFRSQKKYGNENHFFRGGAFSDDKSQNILERAIIKGIIIRKTYCEKCGDSGTCGDGRTKIQAHHNDYNKPLDVTWLCQKCHYDWHKHNKAVIIFRP